MQKFDVYSALLAETDITLRENQRTTFVVFHQSAQVLQQGGFEKPILINTRRVSHLAAE